MLNNKLCSNHIQNTEISSRLICLHWKWNRNQNSHRVFGLRSLAFCNIIIMWYQLILRTSQIVPISKICQCQLKTYVPMETDFAYTTSILDTNLKQQSFGVQAKACAFVLLWSNETKRNINSYTISISISIIYMASLRAEAIVYHLNIGHWIS